MFGFGAGRRALTLSNLANGGAYDDTSGVAMTMGEYQALLRWYDANGTYPSKTLKIALLDASAGRAADGTYLREGSKYYVEQPDPEGPAGPVRDVRRDERERDELSRVPPRHAVLLEQHHERRRRAVAHVRHGHAVGAERALSGHGRAANIAANSAAISQFDTT